MVSLMALAVSAICRPLPIYAQDSQAPEAFVTVLDTIDIQFDPQRSIFSSEAQIFTALYEGLFIYDPSTLDPVKAICRSFSRSKDGKVYVFDLRDGANWSDGTAIVADNFRDSWLRAIDPASQADYASFFDIIVGAKEFRTGKSTDASTVGIRALSPGKLEVRLVDPAPWFTRLLCHHAFSPIHPSMLSCRDWKSALPFPTSGPYTFQSIAEGKLELKANPAYWDAKSVAIPRLDFLFIDDELEATRMFDDGEAHWLAGPMDLDALLSGEAIIDNPLFATNYWFFSSSTKPWNDARLRRALALLLPWDKVRSRDYYPIPATTLVLPMSGYEGVKGIEKQDRTEALRLLSEAGYPEGAGLPPITILTPSGKDTQRVTTLMKTAWESLPGMKVSIRSISPADYYTVSRKGIRTGEFTLAQSTWIGDFADPLAFLQLWVSDSNLNDSGFEDAEFDALIASSSGAEGSDRFDIMKKAETRLLAGAALLPMYHGLSINVIDVDYIGGWYTNPLDIHPYKYLSFMEKRIRSNVALSGPGMVHP